MKAKFNSVVVESLGNLMTAFGLVAALAWNEAVKSLINNFFPSGQGTLSLFVYAFLVTAIAVLAGSRLLKIKEKFSAPQEQ